MLTTESASLIYSEQDREVFACKDVSISIGANQFVGILGPSGSGKSSLLYLLSGLKQPTQGVVKYDGRSLGDMSDDERAQLRLSEFGFVFQQPYLLGYLTALENVGIAAGKVFAREEAEHWLSELGLGEKLNRLPHELSGGERQRVCVARALLGRPKVIFADEPTAALDHRNGHQVVELLNRHRGEGSLVMVTHDPTMLDDSDLVLHMADGELERVAATASV